MVLRALQFPPLCGRATELHFLKEQVRGTAAGRPAVVIVDGPAGAGKSRLVLDAAIAATALGLFVGVASADEAVRVDPFSPLLTALGIAMEPASSGDRSLHAFSQVRSTLEARAAVSPMVLALDDLQWADSATLQVIQTLAGQLDAYPILWLLAARREDPGAPVDRAFRALERRGATRLELAAVPPDDATDLIRDLLGAEPDAELLAIADGAGGNPGLLVELVGGLQDEEAIEVGDGAARLVSAAMPRRLRDLVAYRVGRLSPHAGQVLQVGAVLGHSFAVETLGQVFGSDAADLLGPLEEARNASILVSATGGLEFRHELVRWALYEGIPEPVRIALHRQIGQLLLARGGSAAAAANHLAHGGGDADVESLLALDRATNELGATSPASAADLALHALELTAPTDSARFARSVAAVDALVAAGRPADAAALAGLAVQAAAVPPDVAAQLHILRSELLLLTNQPAAASADAQAALAGNDLSQELRGAAEVARLVAVLAEGDLQQARQLSEVLLAGSDNRGGTVALVGALTALALIAWREGRVADALGLLRAAVQRSEDAPEGAHRAHCVLSLATLLATIGQCDDALELLESTRERGGGGEPAWAALPYTWARVNLAAGRLDGAAADALEALAVAEEMGGTLHVPATLWVLASVALLEGDLDAASARVDAYNAALRSIEKAPVSATYRFTAARVAEARGDTSSAAELLSPIYADPVAHAMLFAVDPSAASCLVRAALTRGDRHSAEAVVAEAELVATGSPGIASLSAGATHARGVARHDLSALDDAALGHSHGWARASALEDSAGVSPTGEARARLDSARRGYDEVGATRDAARVHARLGRTDSRVRAPVEGWASLTDGERTVALLVTEGLTNAKVAERLTVSRHTVDFHLRQTFRKLHINSRVELTRVALEQGWDN